MSKSFDKPPFLDNLIPLKTRLDQNQTAGWKPGPPLRKGLGAKVHADQMIPVAKGISLAVDITTPKLAGRYPAIVAFSAYSYQLQSTGAPTGTNETGEAAVFADHGYNHVVVSRRGMGRSQGDSIIFFNDTDVDDHVAVIEWCAKQPWCDGNVVLFGTSYYGIVQPLVAVRCPPSLKGFFAIGTDTDYFRHVAMTGGAPQVDFLTLWMGSNFTPSQEALYVPPVLRAALSQVLNSTLKRLWAPAVQKRMSGIMDSFKKHKPDQKYLKLVAEWLFDGKTRKTHSIPSRPYMDLRKINVPFVVVHDMGAYNIHQFGAYELFEKAGTKADRKWLIMSPPEYALPVYRWHLEAIAFFDHVIHGADNGYAKQAPVRYCRDGDDEGVYRPAKTFPFADSQKTRLYLSSGGGDADMHHLTSHAGRGHNAWAAVPFGATVPTGLSEVANLVLSFETAPALKNVEYAGSVTLALKFSCSEIDSHVVARLGRVDCEGNYHQLSFGTMRPALRKVDKSRGSGCEIALDMDTPAPLKPKEPVDLRFSLTPRPVLLRKGEKLRLELASRTDLLRSDQMHGYEQFEMMVPPYFSRNKIHFGPKSYLEFEQAPSD